MPKKQRRHLFFINGAVPTEAEQAIADDLNGLVCFRNAKFVRNDEPHAVEDFDELHGDFIPPVYKRAQDAKNGVVDKPAPIASAPPAGATIVPPTPKAGARAWKPNS